MCDKFDRILIHDPMLQLLRGDVFCACSSAVGIWGRMDANEGDRPTRKCLTRL